MLAATASQCNTTRSHLLPWEMVQIDFLLNYAHHHKGPSELTLHLFKYILIDCCTFLSHLRVMAVSPHPHYSFWNGSLSTTTVLRHYRILSTCAVVPHSHGTCQMYLYMHVHVCV